MNGAGTFTGSGIATAFRASCFIRRVVLNLLMYVICTVSNSSSIRILPAGAVV
jgi:hypothetical protein